MSRRWGLLPQANLPIRLETALAFVLLGYTLHNDQSYELYHLASGLPYKAVADVSHWLQMDKPEEFNRILMNF